MSAARASCAASARSTACYGAARSSFACCCMPGLFQHEIAVRQTRPCSRPLLQYVSCCARFPRTGALSAAIVRGLSVFLWRLCLRDRPSSREFDSHGCIHPCTRRATRCRLANNNAAIRDGRTFRSSCVRRGRRLRDSEKKAGCLTGPVYRSSSSGYRTVLASFNDNPFIYSSRLNLGCAADRIYLVVARPPRTRHGTPAKPCQLHQVYYTKLISRSPERPAVRWVCLALRGSSESV
jgi:hypothetical protein